MRRYISLVFVGMLLMIPAVLAEPSASASRSIENKNLVAGDSTNVTVTMTSSTSQALSLMETLPSGWTLVRVSDDADAFRNSTNEWVWFRVDAGMTKTVVYRLDVPSDAAPGTYSINGSITNESGVIASVAGDNTVNVMIPTVTTPGVTGAPAVTGTAVVTGTPVVTTAVPEYPALVLPISAVIGLIMLLLYRRR